MKIKNHPETYVVVPKELLRKVLQQTHEILEQFELGVGDSTGYDVLERRIRQLWHIAGFSEFDPS